MIDWLSEEQRSRPGCGAIRLDDQKLVRSSYEEWAKAGLRNICVPTASSRIGLRADSRAIRRTGTSMRVGRTALSTLLAAILLVGGVAATSAAAQEPLVTPGAAAKPFAADTFAAYADAAMRQWPDPGIAVAVVHGGAPVLLRGFGVREVGKRGPVDERTTFNIGSVTKSFTAALAARMVDGKQLAWDEPLAKLLPEQALPGRHPDETTARDLLSHRSGWASANWSLMPMSRSDIVGRLGALPEAAAPRTRFGYNNIGYLAVGEGLGRRLGMSWDEAVRKHLFEPAGLDDAYTSGAAPAGARKDARPHALIRGRVKPIQPLPVDRVAPAGGIQASARDLARWMLLHLQGGKLGDFQLLSPEAIRAMHSPVMPIPVSPGLKKLFPSTNFYAYGLGWFVQDYRGHKIVQHGGNTAGKSALVVLVPELGFGISVLSNMDNSDLPTALAYRAVDEAIGGGVRDWSKELRQAAPALAAEPRTHRAQAPLSPEQIKRYAGRYGSPLYGQVEVLPTRGGLRFRVDDRIAGLMTPTAEHSFTIDWTDEYLAAVGLKGPIVFTLGESGSASSLTFSGAASPAPVYRRIASRRG